MKIFLGADHRGFKLKEKIKGWLKNWGVSFEDMGNTKYEPEDDFPDFAERVGEKVVEDGGLGILLCGSGGMALEAWGPEWAEHARQHDSANVLALPADALNEESAKKTVKAFLEAKEGRVEEKYQRRLDKIRKIEDKYFI